MITAIALGLALTLTAAEMPESAVPTDDGRPAATEVVETKSVQARVVEQTRAPEAPVIQEVERTESNRDAAMDRQMAPRGSFWWVVGALVVAGIILYVLVG
jgi:hypothetical protein